MSLGVVIPAAGLGTRLEALAEGRSKEMLPLGRQPVLLGALLEAQAAGADEVVAVISPDKADLRNWLQEQGVQVAEQPRPVGTMDAVDRGRAMLTSERVAVVYPDMLHLPDQSALRQVSQAAADHALTHGETGTWYALVRRSEERAKRMGPSARVETQSLGGGRHRITAVHSRPGGEPGALHTALVELRGEREERLLADRRAEGDRGLLPVLSQLAREGRLFGLEPDGEILDAGIPAGYTDALERFAQGSAQWRANER